MIKQISIMSLATVMLFGCATATKVNQAEVNKHPITKVCIQDNRHLLPIILKKLLTT